MADIEPYKQIKKTNIQEHNDLVDKINEIVNVVNETNLESIGVKFNTIDNQIATINNTDSLQWADIQTLKTNDPVQDSTLNQHTEEIKGLDDSLVSDVTIVDGYNMGTFKVRIDRKGTVSIDSNEYALESPVSIELIQGTGPSMFKCQITLSDGRTLVSNDFVFTTEYIGQDIYISSFTFKAGNVDGTISADIGLSNGVTIEANNFAIPVQPTVSNAINDLNSRVQSLEDTTVSDARITDIETKNTEQDSAIEKNATDIQFINTEISEIKRETGQIIKNVYVVDDIPDVIPTIDITPTLVSRSGNNIFFTVVIGDPTKYINVVNGNLYYGRPYTYTSEATPYSYWGVLTESDNPTEWNAFSELLIGKMAIQAESSGTIEMFSGQIFFSPENDHTYLRVTLTYDDNNVITGISEIRIFSNEMTPHISNLRVNRKLNLQRYMLLEPSIYGYFTLT